jgi:hypothetical protein
MTSTQHRTDDDETGSEVGNDWALQPQCARPSKKGLYESFFIKAGDPSGDRAVWIRYTALRRAGGPVQGAVWATVFQRGAPPVARKRLIAAGGLHSDAGAMFKAADALLTTERAMGAAGDDAPIIAWDLNLTVRESSPALSLPAPWLYRASSIRTKSLLALPRIDLTGAIQVDGEELQLNRWPGVLGHNWGSEHAQQWIWLHAVLGDRDWFEAVVGRIRLGPVTLPWLGSATLALGGARTRFSSLTRGIPRPARTVLDDTTVELSLPGRDLTVDVSFHAQPDEFVGWRYGAPSGTERLTYNCSLASGTIRLQRDRRLLVALDVDRAGVLEHGGSTPVPALALRPDADAIDDSALSAHGPLDVISL